MYRVAIEKLLKWKESKRRKPLIIEGARQVGKTWLMQEFGRQAYAETVYINFDSNSIGIIGCTSFCTHHKTN